MYEWKLRINCSLSATSTSTVELQYPSRKYIISNIDREIYYYHIEGEVFINCGINPIGDEIRIDLTDIDTKQPLHIRIKNLGLLHIDRFMYTQTTVANI
jgi:hypothetical protein